MTLADWTLLMSIIGMAWLAMSVTLVIALHYVRQRNSVNAHTPREDRVLWAELERRVMYQGSNDGHAKPILIGTKTLDVQWWGMLPDISTPGMVSATLEMIPSPEPVVLRTKEEFLGPKCDECNGGPQWGHDWGCSQCPD